MTFQVSDSLNLYSLSDNGNGYDFVTKQGQVYEIYFYQNSVYFEDLNLKNIVYDFGFTIKDETSEAVFDKQVELTIVNSLMEYFRKNPSYVLVSICDNSDKKEVLRFRLFSWWYIRHLSNEIEQIAFKLNDLYGSIFISYENPVRNMIKEIIFREFAI